MSDHDMEIDHAGEFEFGQDEIFEALLYAMANLRDRFAGFRRVFVIILECKDVSEVKAGLMPLSKSFRFSQGSLRSIGKVNSNDDGFPGSHKANRLGPVFVIFSAVVVWDYALVEAGGIAKEIKEKPSEG